MRKFKVGEEVTVRTWEDMEKQYGTKNFSPELPKDSFLGSILNELFSGKIILAPHRVVTDVMKPFCGRMRISANPELNVYDIVKVIKPYCSNYLKAIKRSERIIWEAE